MTDIVLFPVVEVEGGCDPRSSSCEAALEEPRLRRPDRQQVLLQPVCLEERLAADDPARVIWAVTGRLDLTAFYAPIRARGSEPGSSAIDPRLLVALWVLAYQNGVGSGRELARLCEQHDAYRWMCGGVSVNYHTLNDFRVAHSAALDELLTRVLAALLHADVVQVGRTVQDGLKVRASAGTGSFRRRTTLEERLVEARAQVEWVKQQAEEAPAESTRRQAAQQRTAEDRLRRLEAALNEIPKIAESKARQRGNKASQQREPRASSTDPDARTMKMPNGGFNPAYNVQIASDPQSRAITAIDVTNHGTDHGEEAALRCQVERRSGRKVHEQLIDGGYVTRDGIERAAQSGVAIYAPLPGKGPRGAVCSHNPKDSPGLAAWRQRMSGVPGRAIYKLRGSTAETINADLRTFRGLSRFTVRGLAKCRCIALWAALAYNLMHFSEVLLKTG